MSAILYPSSMICTINKPLDEKTNALTLSDRNAIPLAQRYRGMVLVIQNTGLVRPQIFWLPTDDLSNAGWSEIEVGASSHVLIPDWKPNTPYVIYQPVVFNDVLYRCTAGHISSSDFTDNESDWETIGGDPKRDYLHVQLTASDTWLIQHNLNKSAKELSIFVSDTTGEQIIGFIDLTASTNNLLVYRFGEALAGEAYVKM